MDTRFWGPSGWKLLHSITFAYESTWRAAASPTRSERNKSCMKTLFEMLPFVLPCKFCRASLTGYMETHPLEPALESKAALTKWLWVIHNEVNKKTRTQGISDTHDPPFDAVKDIYEGFLRYGCSQTSFPGWDFLFSVAELHPMSKSAKESVPISGAPPCETMKTREERNRWNCMEPEERLALYKKFWQALGKVLPFPEWRRSWDRHSEGADEALETRAGTLKWLWQLRCAMERDMNLLNRCKYSSLCKTLKTFRSGCSGSSRAKTCRRRR